MFTGIIESISTLQEIKIEGTNKIFYFQSSLSNELKVDQSISHNGVCLTVVAKESQFYRVTAVKETLQKSTLDLWKVGEKVNIERCMLANGRFDGHIVQGHVDQKGICISQKNENGSWVFGFEFDTSFGNITVEKGSISIDGVSLTCFNSSENRFQVAIIPYTYRHTNFQYIEVGDFVNLEFDIIGKYVREILKRNK